MPQEIYAEKDYETLLLKTIGLDTNSLCYALNLANKYRLGGRDSLILASFLANHDNI